MCCQVSGEPEPGCDINPSSLTVRFYFCAASTDRNLEVRIALSVLGITGGQTQTNLIFFQPSELRKHELLPPKAQELKSQSEEGFLVHREKPGMRALTEALRSTKSLVGATLGSFCKPVIY